MASPAAAELTEFPFGELLSPLVSKGWIQLDLAAAAIPSQMLSPDARLALTRGLLHYLSGFALPTLYSEFLLYQELEGAPLWGRRSGSARAYQGFIAHLRNGGLEEAAKEYPALSQLLESWTSGWARSHGELLRRLREDWSEIAPAFGMAGMAAHIDQLEPYQSDPHHGGDAVSILTMESGARFVYKPRATQMEQWFGDLLSFVNACGFSAPFRVPTILSREGYGWVQYIAHRDCTNTVDVQAFYRRAGGLLCLLALLQATDIHHENLIASGDQPVLVDIETLLQPLVGDTASPAELLLNTGLLPRTGTLDFSALGARATITTPFEVITCRGGNSDAMEIVSARYEAPRRKNAPTVHEVAQEFTAFRDDIRQGFEEVFLLVMQGRSELLARGGLLDRLTSAGGRRVLRSSNDYGMLMQASLAPRFMRDAEARRMLLINELPGASTAELEALRGMNVPHLAREAEEFERCRRQVLERVRGLSEAHLSAYAEALDAALGS